MKADREWVKLWWGRCLKMVLLSLHHLPPLEKAPGHHHNHHHGHHHHDCMIITIHLRLIIIIIACNAVAA